jgi:hypothetical protein
MKELPKSFACTNTNQKLWDKYIKWLNTTYSEKFDGDSDIYQYYGITTNGLCDYHSSIIFFDTIITLEEWDELVNETKIKIKEEVMKTIEITRAQLKDIYDVACATWKGKIEAFAKRNIFGDTINFTQKEVDEMFKAATTSQIPVLEGIFGKQIEDIDLSKGNIAGLELFLKDGNSSSAMICIRTRDEYKNKAFFLNNRYNWDIITDSDGQLCLVPTRE